MTEKEKQYYLNCRTLGYWSADDGIEVKKIEYGIEDYMIVVSGSFTGNRRVHKVKINSAEDRFGYRAYIKINGKRYYTDECIRNGI